MELAAIGHALELLPNGWSGTLYSDSDNALGRIFRGWRMKNVPTRFASWIMSHRARLGEIRTVLLAGHPTNEELRTGIKYKPQSDGTKKPCPVSKHNVWADRACTKAADYYTAEYNFTVLTAKNLLNARKK